MVNFHENIYEYMEGNHGYPYCEEEWQLMDEEKRVWILKEDLVNENQERLCIE
jgi:hypothetical protein